MVRRFVLSIAGALALTAAVVPATAQAQYPGLTLSFTTPTGTAGSHDPVDVWVTLMNTGSDIFAFDMSAVGFGLDPAFVPANGNPYPPGPSLPFANITYVQFTASASCSGSFMAPSCGGASYNFVFNYDSRSFLGITALTLNPGESKDYLFASFNPIGDAPAGTYDFFNAYLELIFNGDDGAGTNLSYRETLAQTCSPEADACKFSRDVHSDAPVTGAPEPATFGLLGLGLGFVGIVSRRRKARNVQ